MITILKARVVEVSFSPGRKDGQLTLHCDEPDSFGFVNSFENNTHLTVDGNTVTTYQLFNWLLDRDGQTWVKLHQDSARYELATTAEFFSCEPS